MSKLIIFIICSFILLSVSATSKTTKSKTQSPSFTTIDFNNEIDCTELGSCYFHNSSLWSGGKIPGINDEAIIDYRNNNTATSVQWIIISQNETTMVSAISVYGNVNLLVVNDTQTIVITLDFGASLQLDQQTTLKTTNITVLTDASILIAGGSTLIATTSFNADPNVSGRVTIGTTTSAGTLISNTFLSIAYLSLGSYSSLTLTGTASITQEIDSQSTSSITLSQYIDLYIGGGDQSVQLSNLVGQLTQGSYIQLDHLTFINNVNIAQNGSSSLVIEITGSDVIIGNAQIPNADLYVAPNATLTLINECNVSPNGGINVDGYFYAGQGPTVLGSSGVVIKSHSAKFFAQSTVVGDVFLENGTFEVNQTTVQGSFYHGGGVLLISEVNNMFNILYNYSQTSLRSNIYLKNIVLLKANASFINADYVRLEGGLYFSIDEAISSSLTLNIIHANSNINGEFDVTQVLNGGVSNRIYVTDYTENYVTIKFNKDDPQDLALWKIFVIILGAIGGIFITSFIIIKIVRVCKRSDRSDYAKIDSDSSRE